MTVSKIGAAVKRAELQSRVREGVGSAAAGCDITASDN